MVKRLEHDSEILDEVTRRIGAVRSEALEECRSLLRAVLRILDQRLDDGGTHQDTSEHDHPSRVVKPLGQTVQVLTRTKGGASQWRLGEILDEQVSDGARHYQVHVLGTSQTATVCENAIKFFPDHQDQHHGPENQAIARYRLKLIREETEPYHEPVLCSDPGNAARFLHYVLEGFDREVVGALFLTNCHRAIGHTVAYVGTTQHASVDPRGIFVPALLSNAAGTILFHTHPSGELAPSRDDIGLTRKIVAAGKMLCVGVQDHIILGEPPSFLSLRVTHPDLFD